MSGPEHVGRIAELAVARVLNRALHEHNAELVTKYNDALKHWDAAEADVDATERRARWRFAIGFASGALVASVTFALVLLIV